MQTQINTRNTIPLCSKTLWAGSLEAKAVLYYDGPNDCELYLSVGGSVPMLHKGSLGAMNNRFDIWLALRKSEGFEEQLPSYNPDLFHA